MDTKDKWQVITEITNANLQVVTSDKWQEITSDKW